jgi:hypothetical protein
MTDEQLFDTMLAEIKERFKTLIGSLPQSPDRILEDRTIPQKTKGVYVFSELTGNTESVMYVGQSKGILGRLNEHCGRSDWNKANFAYMLTVETTGLKPIPYSPNATKQSMFNIPEFKAGFEFSLCRITKMSFRCVTVADKLERNLLEIFAAVSLGSRFNDFDE